MNYFIILIIEFKLVYEVCQTNKVKHRKQIFPPLLLKPPYRIYSIPRAKKSQQKVQI